jgi:hypothetical protein
MIKQIWRQIVFTFSLLVLLAGCSTSSLQVGFDETPHFSKYVKSTGTDVFRSYTLVRPEWDRRTTTLHINLDGTRITAIGVGKSSGYPVLDELFVKWVQNWEFKTGICGENKPICRIAAPLEFRYKNYSKPSLAN